ncbi:MAG: DegV family protein [Clostridia bacterium]|nr:DegV family protein [Clostridia bacterium]
MNIKIVSDSSSNILALQDVAYATVPLKIITAEREYVDDAALDVTGMVQDLKTVKGRTQTSCPNSFEWEEAFADADAVLAVTITSGLSGSYATAMQAKAGHPEKKIVVVDSLSTGPEMALLIERMRDGILAEHSVEEIEADVRNYAKHTHLLFALKSMKNLARNGRVKPLVAKLAGVLDIRIVGVASEQGTLELLHKTRGRKKMLDTIYAEMKERGYAGGKVRISHCLNEEAAALLEQNIRADHPNADITVVPTTALCSYYAEEGGLLVGFESREQ